MAGSILLRSAYHHRLVGYGDFLRKHATPAADSQSVNGRVPTDADGADVAVASSSRAPEAQTSPGPASQEGADPSLGMGLQNVAELPSREPRPEATASAAEGTKARSNNSNKQHSCKCGIFDACTESPRPPTPTCHHVACHSQRECTIFPGHRPVRFVHPDNRETAKIDWLPTNFWAKTAPAAQSEQVSQIKSSFELDQDRELITSITSAVQSGIMAHQRQNANRVRQWKARRTLDIGEDLFKAGLLSKESPLFDIISSHFDEDSSGSGSSSASHPPSAPGNDEDEEMLRFQALLVCSGEVDKMVRDGEITEEEKPRVLVKKVEKVLQALSQPKGEKGDKYRPKKTYPAHAQFRDERLDMAKARAARSVRAAAHGSEPTIRSRLSGEVWSASPTKPVSRDDDIVDSQAKFSSIAESAFDPNTKRSARQDAPDDIIAFLSAMDSFSPPRDSNVASKRAKSQLEAIEGTPNPQSELDGKQDPIDDIIAFLSAMSTTASSSAPKSNVSSSRVEFRSATVEDKTDRNLESNDQEGGNAAHDKTKDRPTTIVDSSDKTSSSSGHEQQTPERVVGEETQISDQKPKPDPGGATSHHADEGDDSDEEEVVLFKGRHYRS